VAGGEKFFKCDFLKLINSAMAGMKAKFRNKLQLSISLRLKITRIDVDVNAVINSNRKQAHQSHTPHYEK
jgi:hypothetical protein